MIINLYRFPFVLKVIHSLTVPCYNFFSSSFSSCNIPKNIVFICLLQFSATQISSFFHKYSEFSTYSTGFSADPRITFLLFLCLSFPQIYPYSTVSFPPKSVHKPHLFQPCTLRHISTPHHHQKLTLSLLYTGNQHKYHI